MLLKTSFEIGTISEVDFFAASSRDKVSEGMLFRNRYPGSDKSERHSVIRGSLDCSIVVIIDSLAFSLA